jgi:two-component system, NtrC family, response regulator HupR/HoxA
MSSEFAKYDTAAATPRLVSTRSSPVAARSKNASRQVILESSALKRVFAEAAQLAAVDVPILVTGESGTGKEVLARYIHDCSGNAPDRFCAVNCGAIPSHLLESTLFGHVKGAFTSADREARGLFREADGGTLFLDEVGELGAASQVALLRVLETKRVRPVGSSQEHAITVRIVSATNRDIEAMVERGLFRLDLYYRVAPVTLEIPPLRSRPEDVRRLTDVFLQQACERSGRAVPEVDPGLREALARYPWPGNARELRYVIERAFSVSAGGDVLRAAHLSERVRRAEHSQAADDIVRTCIAQSAHSVSLASRMARCEALIIEESLRKMNGCRTRAAAELGVPLRTFMRKVAKHGL